MPNCGLNMNCAEAFMVSPETGNPPGPRLVNCTLGEAVKVSVWPAAASAAAFILSLRAMCAQSVSRGASPAGGRRKKYVNKRNINVSSPYLPFKVCPLTGFSLGPICCRLIASMSVPKVSMSSSWSADACCSNCCSQCVRS